MTLSLAKKCISQPKMRNALSSWITRREKAYGSAIFLRWKLTDGSYSCILHVVKAYVAPSKKKSVPCLELTGCLSIARLYSTCKKALEFAEISNCKKEFWIHSQTMLTRVKPLQESSNCSFW